MQKKWRLIIITFIFLYSFKGFCSTVTIDELLQVLTQEISGNRARDYAMRIWQYDKWCTLPMWNNTANEIKTIMTERKFDEAKVVNTPADGVTKYGDWINPIGWDVKSATLEVIEPSDLPDEYKYLCNYRDNPTSLNCFSCPTPPEGIETELILYNESGTEGLGDLNAKGKIILVSESSRRLKGHLDEFGILGMVSDEIEKLWEDLFTENRWLNGWSDIPGGWLMTASDSRNHFGFSISQKKGRYLRKLIRQGKKVRVRSTIDSRYFTDGTFPYITGCVFGAGQEKEEVLVSGHVFEWGATDNTGGSSSILEAVGTLNELIQFNILPRPRRSIRIWLGHEIYGLLAYGTHNLERLKKKTVATLGYAGGGHNYDLSATQVCVYMNPNVCPSFTDAVLPEIVKQYYSIYSPYKVSRTRYYKMTNAFFCDPMLGGVPSNFMTINNKGPRHHNSSDTIDKLDPHSLRDISILVAAFLYFIADADYEEFPFIADLTLNKGMEIVLEKYLINRTKLTRKNDENSLNLLLTQGCRVIEHYADLQKKALKSIERLIQKEKKSVVKHDLLKYCDEISEFSELLINQFCSAVKNNAKDNSIVIVPHKKKEGTWAKEASMIIPRRKIFGTLQLSDIPVDKWKEIKSAPTWWSPKKWSATSYWWCDGKRNLNEIKELIELEAGCPVKNFDLIKYYKFLKKYDRVEFVDIENNKLLGVK
jgi:hypothetical protein